MRTAVIGDVHGWSEPLAAALTDLGCDVDRGLMPPDLAVVQVGDLVHRGPDSGGVLRLVDRFLRADESAARWTQLLGNHEAQYLRPGGPTFVWHDRGLADDERDLLTSWWEDGLLRVAAAVPTGGGGTVVSHAGISHGFARLMARAGAAVDDATAFAGAVDAAPRARRDDAVWFEGAMILGEAFPQAGPLWAEAGAEVCATWLRAETGERSESMPWDQVHGHSSLWDFANDLSYADPQLLDGCEIDGEARHVRYGLPSGHTITGVDPGHRPHAPAASWAPLLLEHASSRPTVPAP